VGESLGDDLAAIIASLTAERDQLRQQVERLQHDNVYLRQQAEEAWERLADLQAAQAREEESERLPF
jgi:regulator of replication initiation timing